MFLIQSNMQFLRKQDYTVPEAIEVKYLAQGPDGKITLPSMGFELTTFWS